ncbi:36368_t:CDS:2, partial [Racocetra persica]
MTDDTDYVFVFIATDTRHSDTSSTSLIQENFGHPSSYWASGSNTANTALPSYEEAVRNSVNPTNVIITPIASSVSQSLEEILVFQDENQEIVSEHTPLLPNNTSGFVGTSIPAMIPPPPEYSLSDASYKTSAEGVTSFDHKLNTDGYHTESRDDSYYTVDSDGNSHRTNQSTNVEVVDFKLTLDLSDYILPTGVIYTIPKKSHPPQGVMQVLREYIEHKNLLKEIEMRKIVIWDYESLTRAISSTIRQQGFRNDLRITYPLRNHIVKVQSDHKFAHFVRNPW